MADPAAGAVISGLVEVIFEKLASIAFKETELIFGAKDKLKRIKNTLSDIKAVLLDAEKQQVTQHFVRHWLQNLKDVAYDIDDVLDLILTQDLEKKVHGRRFAQKLRGMPSRYNLALRLKAICNRLDEIAVNRRNYNFQECQQPSLLSVDIHRERETHSSIQEACVVGREQDTDRIVTRLVSFSSHELQKISVLPIVGLGGMGKTTLAKLLFNDFRTKIFEVKFWVYIPNKFAMRTVIGNIIQSATGESFAQLNMETLKSKLCRILNAQRFLLVLDNVHIEDPNEWLDLMDLLEKVSKSGVIVVTTREDRVAVITGAMDAHKIKPLSEDHCWSIFEKCAFREGEEKAYPLLVQIGKDIIRKCCGVPLAAKTLGCQLRTVRDESTWRSIEESELWKIEQEPSGILPSLKLSYDQLPYYLRPCFAYCSTLPKSVFLSKDDMINRWMALGLLQSEKINGALEDIGNRYFNELESRSIFEPVHPSGFFAYIDQQKDKLLKHWPKNMFEQWHEVMCLPFYEKRFFQMHDLVHDLAKYVAVQETTFMGSNSRNVSEGVRHLVWEEEEHLPEREFPHQIETTKKARTLIFHCRKSNYCMSRSFLQGLITNFQRLRILSLSDFDFENLPHSIGDLRHLRYLSLASNNQLRRLPDSICKLVNLQTLNVLQCVQLELIPRDLHRLVSLRYLMFTSKVAILLEKCVHWASIQAIVIFNCIQLRSLPKHIGSLTTLRILRIIHCPCLSSLPRSLRHLNHLERLVIEYCKNMDLMGWEGLCGLSCLKYLHLQRLPRLIHFPDGLQSIRGSLRHLNIVNCQNLIALPEHLQHCTSLLYLTLVKCPGLSALPNGIQALRSLQHLYIADCPNLNPRCEREIGDDWHLISHIPKIEVDHCCIQNKGSPTF